MPFDVDRYNRLRESAVFNMEAWRGTYQDQSRNRLAMTAGTQVSWGQLNGLPVVATTAASAIQSGAVDGIIDVTTPFCIEVLFIHHAYCQLFYQLNNGGVYISCLDYAVLRTITAVGGTAHQTSSAAASLPYNKWNHFVVGVNPLTLSALWWVGGVPIASAWATVGVPANTAPAVFRAAAAGPAQLFSVRAWQGTPTNSDAACLYGAARALTGGEV